MPGNCWHDFKRVARYGTVADFNSLMVEYGRSSYDWPMATFWRNVIKYNNFDVFQCIRDNEIKTTQLSRWACMYGAIDILRYLIRRHGYMRALNRNVFHCACVYGDMDCIQLLVDYGYRQPVHGLFRHGHFDIIKRLEAQGVIVFDFRLVRDVQTHACTSGRVDLVEYLVNSCTGAADELIVDLSNCYVQACMSGNVDMVKYVLAWSTYAHISYMHGLHIALQGHSLEMVQFLYDAHPHLLNAIDLVTDARIAAFLLDRGANLDELNYTANIEMFDLYMARGGKPQYIYCTVTAKVYAHIIQRYPRWPFNPYMHALRGPVRYMKVLIDAGVHMSLRPWQISVLYDLGVTANWFERHYSRDEYPTMYQYIDRFYNFRKIRHAYVRRWLPIVLSSIVMSYVTHS